MPTEPEFSLIIRIKRLAMGVLFYCVLKPLIKRNYKNRMKSAAAGEGKHPDEWYWADKLAARSGYCVSIEQGRS